MKITKKNGKVVIYDDEKVINSILKANAEVPQEQLNRKRAAVLANEVFTRVTEESEIIRTEDVRACVAALLRENGCPLTAEHYLGYKK